MIDYNKQAYKIFNIVVSSPVLTTEDTIKQVEEMIRKIGHVEQMCGYMERKREEDKRHGALKEQLDAARNRLNMPQVG